MLSTFPKYYERHVWQINDSCYVNSLALWLKRGFKLQYAIGCMLLDTPTVVLK